jgi:hypothetical protein
MYKKIFTITIYSDQPENTEDEQTFINDMQNRVDALGANTYVNTVETAVENIGVE